MIANNNNSRVANGKVKTGNNEILVVFLHDNNNNNNSDITTVMKLSKKINDREAKQRAGMRSSESKGNRRNRNSYTVSGQNTIGIYITPLVLIQLTDVEQNAVNSNSRLSRDRFKPHENSSS